MATKALEPVGLIILVTGAGGVFGEVLVQSGMDSALQGILEATSTPVIVLGFLAAVLVRVSLGSATVLRMTHSRSAPSIPAAAPGPGVGGTKLCVAASPAMSGMA